MIKRTFFLLAIALGFIACTTEPKPVVLGELTLVESDGKPIDDNKPAYVGPTVYDYNNDGLNDLVIGDFVGNIKFYKNVGSKSNPEYKGFEYIKAEGRKAKIENW